MKSKLDTSFYFDFFDDKEDLVYDSIINLASEIMGTKTSLISLTDSTQQWFKSKINNVIKTIPKEYSFCSHTIQNTSMPFIVNDASIDNRFSSNPYVCGDLKIKFYFGVPLVDSNNEAIGAICTIDTSARETPTEAQIQSLKNLSTLVMYQFELRQFITDISSQANDCDNAKVLESLNDKLDSVLKKIKLRKTLKDS